MSINLTNTRTLVVKVGTSLLSGPHGFDGRIVEGVVKELCELKKARGLNIILVSSGAIGCGMDVLGLKERPRLLPLKQATAAVGQSRLMHYYETLFQTYGNGMRAAQILISTIRFDDRGQYLNIRNTINTLFEFGNVIPVVNENDTVSTEQLTFGDNDTLSARVAVVANADLLIILSDVDGLFDKNPAKHADAKIIPHLDAIDDAVEALAEDTITETTIGGMKTKLAAARIACKAGVPMVITNGHRERVIHSVLDGTGAMTTFGASPTAMPHRKRWIAYGRRNTGTLRIDDGAKRALIEKGSSLLAAGISAVEGVFEQGAAVAIVDSAGKEFASGLVNYRSTDIERIRGKKSSDIREILGRQDFDEVIHRDNLVIL